MLALLPATFFSCSFFTLVLASLISFSLSEGTRVGMPAFAKNRYSDMSPTFRTSYCQELEQLEPKDHTHQFASRCAIAFVRVKHRNDLIWRILIWRLAGRSAKPPNLIPRQIFRLYGIYIYMYVWYDRHPRRRSYTIHCAHSKIFRAIQTACCNVCVLHCASVQHTLPRVRASFKLRMRFSSNRDR